MAGRRRGLESVGDMVRSLGLVLAAVGVLLLITLRPQGQTVQVVDWSGTLSQARVGAPYALVAPVGLPTTWRATSVYFDPPARTGIEGVTTWHVGFVTPTTTYAAFEQTNGSVKDMLGSVLSGPVRSAEVSTVAGVPWERWTDSSSKRALVRTVGKVSVVVDGSASWADLETLAASLQPQPALAA